MIGIPVTEEKHPLRAELACSCACRHLGFANRLCKQDPVHIPHNPVPCIQFHLWTKWNTGSSFYGSFPHPPFQSLMWTHLGKRHSHSFVQAILNQSFAGDLWVLLFGLWSLALFAVYCFKASTNFYLRQHSVEKAWILSPGSSFMPLCW